VDGFQVGFKAVAGMPKSGALDTAL